MPAESMPDNSRSTESELRDALQNRAAPASALPEIDAASVIRRARGRRMPKQLAFGSLATLAVAGIVVVGFNAIPMPHSAMMAAQDSSGGAESSALAPTPNLRSGAGLASAESVNPCGGELAEVAPSASGLVLTPRFPTSAPANGKPVVGIVTLTNTGTTRVTGSTVANPTVTLSQNGVTLWHSNGPMIAIAVLVDLAPGESIDYRVTLQPVACGPEDELGGFREDLPALPPGDYRLSALIDLVPENLVPGNAGDPDSADDQANGGTQLVGGPAQTITLK